ncbi:MAG: hypothetical protein IJM14_04305 [Lachnospiraceae bacterium]|nr:hypothetical protein [Lachnospiraceae bacterium]
MPIWLIIIISLVWIIIVRTLMLDLIPYIRTGKTKELHENLSEIFFRWAVEFIPVLYFWYVNLLILLYRKLDIVFFVIVVLEFFVPLLYYVFRRIKNNPRSVAKSARKASGEYKEYDSENDFLSKYILQQIEETVKKIGGIYYVFPLFVRKRYINAIVRQNKDVLPGLKTWEIKERWINQGGSLFLFFDNGEKLRVDNIALGIRYTVNFYRTRVVVPFCIFNLTNILIWMFFNPKTLPVLWALLAFIVLINFLKLLVFSPKRMAKYAGTYVGTFEKFAGKNEKYSGLLYENETELKTGYVCMQLRKMIDTVGSWYLLLNRSAREKFVIEILNANLKKLPGFESFEEFVLNPVESWYYLSFENNEKGVIKIYWRMYECEMRSFDEKDAKLLSIRERFKNITMTGRLAYIIMCIERYMQALHPERDFTLAAKRMWKSFEKNGWKEVNGPDPFSSISIIRITESESYESARKTMKEEFDEETYDEIIADFRGFTTKTWYLRNRLQFMMEECDGTIYDCRNAKFDYTSCEIITREHIRKAEERLDENNIPYPDMEMLKGFTFETDRYGMPVKMKAAWGFGADISGLSIFLKKPVDIS